MEKNGQPNKQQNNSDAKLSLWGMLTSKEQLSALCVAATYAEDKEELYLYADALGLSGTLAEREKAISQENL
jgi:hypothetical protein